MKPLLPCPACKQLLYPPEQASRLARLRCPYCLYELQADHLLDATRATWIVLHDPGGDNLFEKPHPLHATPSTLAPRSDSTHDEDLQLIDDLSESSLVDQQFAEPTGPSQELAADGESTINWQKFQPVSHEEFRKRRRHEESPIKTFVQIILGGLFSIPVALGILWYGLGQDIGQAGPTVAKFAPWLVPTALRGHSSSPTPSIPNLPPSRVSPLDRDSTPPSSPTLPNINLQGLNILSQNIDAFLANRDDSREVRNRLAKSCYQAGQRLAEDLDQMFQNGTTRSDLPIAFQAELERIAANPLLTKLFASGGKFSIQSGLKGERGLVCVVQLRGEELTQRSPDAPLIGHLDDTSSISLNLPFNQKLSDGDWLILAIADETSLPISQATIVALQPLQP